MIDKIKQKIDQFSQREKFLAGGAVLVVAFIVISEVITPLWDKVGSTSQQLQTVRERFEVLPNQIDNFQKLYTKQAAIEKEFQELSFADGVLSHIETLIREEARLDSISEYKINPLPVKDFSDQYQQEPFKIELYVTSIPDLTNFLNQLVHGPQPLVLTSLDIKKAPNRTKLIVQLNVSNFKLKESV